MPLKVSAPEKVKDIRLLVPNLLSTAFSSSAEFAGGRRPEQRQNWTPELHPAMRERSAMFSIIAVRIRRKNWINLTKIIYTRNSPNELRAKWFSQILKDWPSYTTAARLLLMKRSASLFSMTIQLATKKASASPASSFFSLFHMRRSIIKRPPLPPEYLTEPGVRS